MSGPRRTAARPRSHNGSMTTTTTAPTGIDQDAAYLAAAYPAAPDPEET